jgi:hypothetical protein
MAIETKKETIGGHEVAVTQFPARQAIKLKIKLARIFGPGLAELLGSATGEGKALSERDIPGSAFSSAFQRLAEAVDPDLFMSLIEEVLSSTRIDGHEVDWAVMDQNYAGDLGTLYRIVFFALRVNYSSFFEGGGIGNMIRSRLRQPPSQSPGSGGSSQESTKS